jgi:hypothetical protein
MLSRAKPALEQEKAPAEHHERKKAPKLETFIHERDYIGAITLLEVAFVSFFSKRLFLVCQILGKV